jgi:tight adherence protein B
MFLFLSIVVCVWALAVGTWLVLTRYTRSSDAGKIRTRLLGRSPAKKSKGTGKVALFEVDEKPKGRLIPRLMEKYNLQKRLGLLIEQAGMKGDPVRLVHKSMACFLGTWLLAFLFLSDDLRPYAVAVAGIAAWVPILSVIRKRRARLHEFEKVFPDSLEFIARSMRAGHAFSVSLEMIHREFPEPLASEFRRTFEEHNLGLPLDAALQGLSRRVPLLDVQFFVSAVMLQKRTGGNLAEILDKLAYVIRERFKLRGRIKAISAHGKMTGLSLTCIPIGVGVLMSFTNPQYVQFFFQDELGNMLLAAGVGLQIVGYLIIRKIVAIEV